MAACRAYARSFLVRGFVTLHLYQQLPEVDHVISSQLFTEEVVKVTAAGSLGAGISAALALAQWIT